MSAIDDVLAKIVADEGGVADVGDGMGITYYGQTLPWLAQYGLTIPTSPAEAIENWKKWLVLARLDQIVGPTYDELAHIVIDYAVHSGSVLAARALQCALHVDADGVIGPKTLAALAAADREQLACEVIASELEFQGVIITKYPEKNAKQAAGWAARNARMVRRLKGKGARKL